MDVKMESEKKERHVRFEEEVDSERNLTRSAASPPTGTSLRSVCRRLVNGVFFMLFLALFLIPLYLSVFYGNDDDTSLSNTEQTEINGENNVNIAPTHTDDTLTTDPLTASPAPHTTKPSSSSRGFLSVYSDWKHSLPTAQCERFFQSHSLTHCERSVSEYGNDTHNDEIDFLAHTIPVNELLKSLSLVEIQRDSYRVSKALVREALSLLSWSERERESESDRWASTRDDESLSVETAIAVYLPQNDLSREQCTLSDSHTHSVPHSGGAASISHTQSGGAASVSHTHSEPHSRGASSVPHNALSQSPFSCPLMQRAVFSLSTPYSHTQVFEELVSVSGLSLLLSTSHTQSLNERALVSVEWHNGSIEVVHAMRPTFGSFFLRSCLLLKIVDRVTQTLTLKSLSFFPPQTHSHALSVNEKNELREWLYSHALSTQDEALRSLVSRSERAREEDVEFLLTVHMNTHSKNHTTHSHNNQTMHTHELRVLRYESSRDTHRWVQWLKDVVDQSLYFESLKGRVEKHLGVQ